MTTTQTAASSALNSVTLRGRVSSAPLERELPSGDTMVTLRLTMAREPGSANQRSRQSSDWVDCVAWAARMRRTVATWQVGDQVEIEGALRRRFYRAGGATSTRLEVELLRGRRLARAREESS
jgi:single-strand DNA-binding protein